MGLFDWFSAKSKPKLVLNTSSSRTDQTQPMGRTQHPPTGEVNSARAPSSASAPRESSQEQRKNARYMRRELLYGVVRESMIRCGVLSAGYKFKALALDPRGLQFMVMVDLAPEFGSSTQRWREIENMISSSAKTRHGIVVTGVYWRISDLLTTRPASAEPAPQPSLATAASMGAAAGATAVAAVAAGAAARPATSAAHAMPTSHRPPVSRPMPLFPEGQDEDGQTEMLPDSGAVPLDLSLDEPGQARRMIPGSSRFEPIDADEVEAFKRALAAGAGPTHAQRSNAQQVKPAATAQGLPAKATDNYTLLTGFEDTEAADQGFTPPALGTTQYGELR